MREADINPDIENLVQAFGVSRETIDRLEIYQSLLEKWQGSINLVGPATLHQFWTRHVADSAQLVALAPPLARRWVDLGSGGGFPGLVIALIWASRPATDGGAVHLLESDGRKCEFLKTVVRETGAPAVVHEGRIEEIGQQNPDIFAEIDVISARALAPLDKLLLMSLPYFDIHTIGLFMKGRGWQEELTASEVSWNMGVEVVPSKTDEEAKILICRQPELRQSGLR